MVPHKSMFVKWCVFVCVCVGGVGCAVECLGLCVVFCLLCLYLIRMGIPESYSKLSIKAFLLNVSEKQCWSLFLKLYQNTHFRSRDGIINIGRAFGP